MNTDATGVAKYPASSRPATMNTLRMTRPGVPRGVGASHQLRRELPEHILQLPGRMPPHEFRRSLVRHDSPFRYDDCARANRVDFLEDMRGDDDRLVRRHLSDQRAHLVFLVWIEPIGRL